MRPADEGGAMHRMHASGLELVMEAFKTPKMETGLCKGFYSAVGIRVSSKAASSWSLCLGEVACRRCSSRGVS